MNYKHSLDFCRSFCFWIEHTHPRLNCINPINWCPCEAATCVSTNISTLIQFRALKIQTHHIIDTNYIHSYIRELIGGIVKEDSQITLLESTMYFMILRPKANGVKLFLTRSSGIKVQLVKWRNICSQLSLGQGWNKWIWTFCIPTSDHRDVFSREKGVSWKLQKHAMIIVEICNTLTELYKTVIFLIAMRAPSSVTQTTKVLIDLFLSRLIKSPQ